MLGRLAGGSAPAGRVTSVTRIRHRVPSSAWDELQRSAAHLGAPLQPQRSSHAFFARQTVAVGQRQPCERRRPCAPPTGNPDRPARRQPCHAGATAASRHKAPTVRRVKTLHTAYRPRHRGQKCESIIRFSGRRRLPLGDRSSKLTPVSSWIRMIGMSPSTVSIVVVGSSPARTSKSRATGAVCLWRGRGRSRTIARWGIEAS